jgi:hypothetical protein
MSLALVLASCGTQLAQPDASFAVDAESSSSGREVKGVISAVDTANNTLTVGAITAWVNGGTRIKQGGVYVALSAVVVGSNAEMKYSTGSLNGAGQPYASKIEVKSGSASGSREVKGTIAAVDTGALTLSVGAINLWANASTLIKLNDAPTPFASLVLGQSIEVKYDTAQLDGSGRAYASKIEIKSGSGVLPELKGQVTAVDSANLTVTVGTRTFWANGSTYIERNDMLATFADIAVGNWLEVKYDNTNLDGSGNAYTPKIEIKSGTSSGGSKEYKGLVSLFDSGSQSFTLGTYTVVVTPSTTYKFKKATITAVTFWGTSRNGRKVEVKGSLSGTVVTATSIKYE